LSADLIVASSKRVFAAQEAHGIIGSLLLNETVFARMRAD